MNKNQIFAIGCLIIGMSSCKKDSVEYPITYSSYLGSTSNIKAYTKDGEVSSATLTNSIVKRYQYYLNKLGTDDISGKIVATYISEDSVELTIDNVKENKRRSVHENAGVVFWEKQDTSMYGFGPLFEVEYLYKYRPIYYYEYFAPPGSGYLRYAKFKECYFIIKNGKKLNIPMFDFLWIDDGRIVRSISGINNSFSKDGLTNFFANDTMLIREYTIEMK